MGGPHPVTPEKGKCGLRAALWWWRQRLERCICKSRNVRPRALREHSPAGPRSRTSGLQNRERHISAVLSHSACGPVTAATGSEDPQRSPCRRGWGAARVRPVSQSSDPPHPPPQKRRRRTRPRGLRTGGGGGGGRHRGGGEGAGVATRGWAARARRGAGTDPQGGARRWGLGPQRNRASGSHVIQGSERVRAGRRRRARGERFKCLCFIEGSLE